MLTYIVQRGDSLYTIARRFDISVEAIMRANGLGSAELNIGQALAIPVPLPYVYTAQPGDTLYTIAQRFGTTVEALMLLNDITVPSILQVARRLRIPVYTEAIVTADTANIRASASTGAPVVAQMDQGARLAVTNAQGDWLQVRLYNGRIAWVFGEVVRLVPHDGSRPVMEILGYYTEAEGPALPSSYQVFTREANRQSVTGMFHFRIDRDNPTRVEKFPATFTDAYMRDVVQYGHRHNIKMLPVVHNLLYERGNQAANKGVIRRMLATESSRSAFIQSVVRLLEEYQFDGVNIDFEDVYYEDRDLLSAFYRELGREMHRRGYYFAVAVPSRTSDRPTNPFSAPFDYAVLGEAVDELVVMLYNEHGWPGSGPGPVVSSGWFESVIRYTLTKMPGRKITAAVSVFGFDFNLTTKRNTYATFAMAMDIAAKYNKEVIFDEKTETPMFAYTDEAGNKHEVWFENTDSIRAKLREAHRLGIRGIALWRMGMEDPGIWPMLDEDFVVRKSVR